MSSNILDLYPGIYTLWTIDGITEDNFTKYDKEKPKISFIPPEFILELSKILTEGATKYSPGNWKHCKDLDRYYDAFQRHVLAWKTGERLDESGHNHLAHAACNIMFLWWLDTYDKAKNKQS